MQRKRREVNFDTFAWAYARSRRLSDEAAKTWRRTLGYLFTATHRVVDVGAGTGIWSRALAGWFGSRVVGVDPSAGMLREARNDAAEVDVHYVQAAAERLPLADDSFDRAWFSTVVDHFPDLIEAAREAHRVLRPRGLALVRDAFADRLEDVTVFRYFPEAADVARETGLTFAELVSAFRSAAFDVVEVRTIEQGTAPDLATYLARVRSRANSNLQAISDEAFDRGIERIQRDALRSSSAVIDRLSLVVFEALHGT